MNKDEARLLLDASTLSPEAGSCDDEVREALEMARGDDELRGWFAQRQGFDERMADAMSEIPVPQGLRDRILESAGSLPKSRSSTFRLLMAMAAVVVICGSWFAWINVRSTDADLWVKDSLAVMTKIETDPPRVLDIVTHDMNEVRALLAKAGAPLPPALPQTLAPGMTVGCKVFERDGRRATIVCFEIEPGVVAHLAVVEGVDVSRLAKDHPEFAQTGVWNTAAWAGDGRAYVMATRGSAEALKKIFA
jgi:hypothetical protein